MAEPRRRWQIRLESSAARQIRKLPAASRDRIVRALENLAAAYPDGDVKKLRDRPGEWRLRVGERRIIFRPIPSERTLAVIHIANRDKAYR